MFLCGFENVATKMSYIHTDIVLTTACGLKIEIFLERVHHNKLKYVCRLRLNFPYLLSGD